MSKSKKKTSRKSVASKAAPTINTTLWSIVIGAFAFLLYANTIGHGWVLDDYSAIKENFITQRGFAGIPDLWAYHYRHGFWNSPGELYRPLILTLFAIEWQISPDNPSIHHFFNVVYYALSCVIIYRVSHQILPKKWAWAALAAAFIYVALPVHTEVVANIKSRDEILANLFSWAALGWWWKYLKTTDKKYLIGAVGVYALAMFSKENAITFLAIFPLTAYYFKPKSWQKAVPTAAFFLLPVLLYLGVRASVLDGLSGKSEFSSLDNFLVMAPTALERLASAFRMLGEYILKLFVPIGLVSDKGFAEYTTVSFANLGALAGLVVSVGSFAAGIWALLKRKYWGFGILFFWINFSIFTNIFITIGSSYGERFLYLPSYGFAFMIAALAFKPTEKSAAEVRNPLSAFPKSTLALAVILIGFSGTIIVRNIDWKSSLSLYAADVQQSPNSAKLNFHYGLELVQKGLKTTDPNEKNTLMLQARSVFEKAIEIVPTYHDAYSQLGLTYYRQGNREKALELYREAIKHKPNFPLVYSNMGTIFMEQGNRKAAIDAYRSALKYDPRFVDARRNLGASLAMEGNFVVAIQEFETALEYDPNDYEVLMMLSSAYRDSGQPEKSKAYLQRAERAKNMRK